MACLTNGICFNTFNVHLADRVTNKGNGFQSHRYGSQYWVMEGSIDGRRDDLIRQVECIKHLHESGAGEPVCLYDIRRTKPKSVLDAIAAAQTTTTVVDTPEEWADFFGQAGVGLSEWSDFFGDTSGEPATINEWSNFFSAVSTGTGSTSSPAGGSVASSSTADGTLTLTGIPSGFVLSCGDWVGYTDADGREWAHMVAETITVNGDTAVKVRPRPEDSTAAAYTVNFDNVHVPMVLEFSPTSTRVGQGMLTNMSVSGFEYVPVF